MELLMNTQKECQQLEVYGEYLKKNTRTAETIRNC